MQFAHNALARDQCISIGGKNFVHAAQKPHSVLSIQTPTQYIRYKLVL